MQQENNQVLGRETRGPISAEQLDPVPGNHGDTDATAEFSTDELTAICPVTGQPDFYELKLSYRPGPRPLESKARKLYLGRLRDRGICAEDMAAALLKDRVAACNPTEMTVDLTQKV